MALCALHLISLESFSHEEALKLLNAKERERASHFHFARDRKGWVAARAALRCVLGHYTVCAPEAVDISLGKRNRPALPASSLDFNLSHADGYLLVGVSDRCRLGVDLEPYTRGPALEECISSFCSEEEQKRLAGCSDPRDLAIESIRLWCAKEAFLKALGTGLEIEPATLTTKPKAGGGFLLSAEGCDLAIHFPSGARSTDYCCAVALPKEIPCPEISGFVLPPDLAR